MNSHSRVYILNPLARSGTALREWAKVKPRWSREGDHEHHGDPSVLVSQGFEEWVVVGGDGSVQRAIQVLFGARHRGVIQSLPRVSIIPLGTGGDYARSLSNTWQPADVGEVHLDDQGPRYFANVASIGFSALVAEAKEQNPKWLPRSLAYLAPTFLELRRARPIELCLESDSTEWKGKCWAIFICKGRHAGGGMQFGTEVQLDDGTVEISWVEDLSVPDLLRRIPSLFLGGLRAQPGVRKLRTQTLSVSSSTKFALDLDGEPFYASCAAIRVIPAAESGLQVRRLSL